MIEDKERYTATIQLIANADSGSWSRFNSFLVFAGMLFAGWLLIYTQPKPPQYAVPIELVLGCLGMLSGFAWAALGWRSRRFVREYVSLGRQLEARNPPMDGKPALSPCTATADLRDTMPLARLGTFYILMAVPLLSSGLFGLLLFVTFRGAT